MVVEPDDSGRGGDARRQVGAWFDAHVDTIHRYIARRAGDDVALDVTAETFRVALEQFDRFDRSLGDERAWLYGIATNLLRRHWRDEQRLTRTHRRLGEATRVPGDPLVAVDERIDAERDAERILDAIDRLDPDDRELLVLVAWEHLSSAEISAALDVPASTIRARVRRIRLRLRSDQGAST